MKEIAPNARSVKMITYKRLGLAIIFCLAHKKLPKIIPDVPPMNVEGISLAGVRKCPMNENKTSETPVIIDIIKNIVTFLFLKIMIFMIAGFTFR